MRLQETEKRKFRSSGSDRELSSLGWAADHAKIQFQNAPIPFPPISQDELEEGKEVGWVRRLNKGTEENWVERGRVETKFLRKVPPNNCFHRISTSGNWGVIRELLLV